MQARFLRYITFCVTTTCTVDARALVVNRESGGRQNPSAVSRNQRHLTTDFTDFTDEDAKERGLVSAAAGKIMEGKMIGKPWDYRLTIAQRRDWRGSGRGQGRA
jgi:hypothetical protein